ncbi:MAG TPA: hypothetical protein VM324_11370 [Egibacteraceae bacterium]|nr:hypothetical protein [Egibacteraceae bacterium]
MTTNDRLSPPAAAAGTTGGNGRDGGKAKQVGGAAKQEGQQLAESAAQEARSVGETVQEQAGRVAEDVSVHAQDLVSSAASQLEEQAEQQAHKLAEALRGAGEQARALAEGRTEEAGDVDRYVHQVSGTLIEIAGRIDELGARGSIEELQQFARRRPGAFLAGAAAAGLLTSRLLRNARADSSDGAEGTPDAIPATPPGAPDPALDERVQRLGATRAPRRTVMSPRALESTGAQTGAPVRGSEVR